MELNENGENLEKIKMITKNWLREYEPLLNKYEFRRAGGFGKGFKQSNVNTRYFYIDFLYNKDPFTAIGIMYDTKFGRFSADILLDILDENGERKEYKRLSMKELFSILNTNL